MKKSLILLTMSFLFITFLTGCGPKLKVDWELKITGNVSKEIFYSYDELANLPQKKLNDILMDKSKGEDEISSWSGVSVWSILEKSGISEDFETILAVASDGYSVEIEQEALKDAIIALKNDSEWIAISNPDFGPIRLVVPGSPSKFWIFQLVELQVN